MEFYDCLSPICSMVLVYLTTKLGDFVRANVGKYSIHGAYGILGIMIPTDELIFFQRD